MKFRKWKQNLLASLQALGLVTAPGLAEGAVLRDKNLVETVIEDPMVAPFTALQAMASFVIIGCGSGRRASGGCGGYGGGGGGCGSLRSWWRRGSERRESWGSCGTLRGSSGGCGTIRPSSGGGCGTLRRSGGGGCGSY